MIPKRQTMGDKILILGDAVSSKPVPIKRDQIEVLQQRGGRDPREARVIVANTFSAEHAKSIDMSRLKLCREAYQISADPRDFIVVPLQIVTVGVPNRNGDAFPYNQVSRWIPRMGMATWETFKWKPTCRDHDNQDPVKAAGVHFDSALHRWRQNPRIWKISVLAGFDRTKYEDVAKGILDGSRNGYSMGALVDRTRCSICGEIASGQNRCGHPKHSVHNGVLAYDVCEGINYIETSNLEKPPADPFAREDNFF